MRVRSTPEVSTLYNETPHIRQSLTLQPSEEDEANSFDEYLNPHLKLHQKTSPSNLKTSSQIAGTLRGLQPTIRIEIQPEKDKDEII